MKGKYAINSSESEKTDKAHTLKHIEVQIPSEGLKPLYQQDIYKLSLCSNSFTWVHQETWIKMLPEIFRQLPLSRTEYIFSSTKSLLWKNPPHRILLRPTKSEKGSSKKKNLGKLNSSAKFKILLREKSRFLLNLGLEICLISCPVVFFW